MSINTTDLLYTKYLIPVNQTDQKAIYFRLWNDKSIFQMNIKQKKRNINNEIVNNCIRRR